VAFDRPEFWQAKISRNRMNDAHNEKALSELGWRHGIVCECGLKGRAKLPLPTVIQRCVSWLRSDRSVLEIRGTA
jgi:DNA mismatch endonuclease (patch repair protein)